VQLPLDPSVLLDLGHNQQDATAFKTRAPSVSLLHDSISLAMQAT